MERFARFALCVVILVAIALAPLGADADEGVHHTVRWGETLTRIARMYGVTVESLVEANGLENPNAIYVGQDLVIPPTPGVVVVHTVKPGESLLSIADQYGVNMRDIAKSNGIYNTHLLFVGDKLIIPGLEGGAQPVTITPAPVPEEEPGVPEVRESIIIAEPADGARVSSPLKVKGWASGFEDTLTVDILDGSGQPVGQGFAIIDAKAGGYAPFEGMVEFAAPRRAQDGRVRVYSISPRDGAIEHLSSVSVRLSP